ncbi:TonB-dependent receptor [Alcaligenaceae bacterium]|nr:TonB-dependent receptor [Alcaligenaceae bacterium]
MSSTRPFPLKASSVAVGCALAGLLPLSCVMAQSASTPVTQLPNVVVTATGFEQAIADAPASISVITSEDLEGKFYRDVTDALQDIPGVSIEGGAGGKIESTSVNIRGMGENYVLFLIDGKPLGASSEAYYNGFGGGAQTSWLPPLSAIERIEVIRGPMSSLYGSSALGGVINVITKKVPPEWTGSVTVDGVFQGDSDAGNAYQGRYYLSGPLIDDRLAMTVYGSKYRRLEDSIQGGYAAKDRIDNTAKFTWKLNEQHSLELEGGHARNKNDRSEESSTDPMMMHNERTVYGLTHDWRWGRGAETKSWVLHESVDIVNGDIESGYRATTFNTKTVVPFDAHMLTVGAEYKQEKTIHDESRFQGSIATNLERWQAALFAENEWSLTDRLTLTGGARLDKNEHYGTHFTPRLYSVYRLTDNLNLKGGVSGGYKTPSLKQADDNIVEPAARGRSWDKGNSDLQPEKSTNFEFGFAYATPERLNFSVMAYYTRFKDKIGKEYVCNTPVGAPPACVYGNNPPRQSIQQYVNLDSATLRGIEAAFGMPVTDKLMLNTSYTLSDSEIKSGDSAGQALNNTPRHMFNVGLDYQLNNDLKLWTKTKYKSKSIDGGTDEIPAYTIVDLGATYRFSKNVLGFAGIYNALDKQIDSNEYGKHLDGRRYYAGLTIEY